MFAFCCLSYIFLYSGQEDYSFVELMPMAVIGIIGGLLGMMLCSKFKLYAAKLKTQANC